MPASISFSSTIPTTQPGGLYTHKELMEIAEVCRKSKTLVLADEIYALTTYDIETFVSMGTVYPEGTFVTGGLSKDRSSAGYRFEHVSSHPHVQRRGSQIFPNSLQPCTRI